MATMSLTKAEQKQMRDTHECPCCGKSMTATQVNSLMADADQGAGEVSESYRGMRGMPSAIELPDGAVLNLREAGERVDMHEAAVRARAEERLYHESWASLLGNSGGQTELAAERAVRGPDLGMKLSVGARRSLLR